jgi:hypothetical protein
MTSEAQRRANQKQDATRKRVALWVSPATAKKVDRAVKKLGLPSRVAWVEHCLKSASGTLNTNGESKNG